MYTPVGYEVKGWMAPNDATTGNPLFSPPLPVAMKGFTIPNKAKKHDNSTTMTGGFATGRSGQVGGIDNELKIEGYYDRGNFYDFLTLTRELAAPGELAEALTLPFEFRGVEMQYESYHGLNVRLRYMLRVTVTRAYGGTVVKENLSKEALAAINTLPVSSSAVMMGYTAKQY